MRTYRFTANLSAPTHKRLDAFLHEQKDLWNAALEERIDAYKKGRSVSYLNQQKSLTELRQECPEHRQYHLHSQRSALRRLDKAFQAFFRRVKAGQSPGFPRFRSIRRVRSFETFQFALHSKGGVHSVAIKGIGRFRFKGELPEGGYKQFRVAKTPKRVQASIVCELPERLKLVDKRPAMGLDLGVECLYALSNGELAPGIERDKGEIKRRQRKLARAKKGSNNRAKKRLSLAKASQAERERARGRLHEISRASADSIRASIDRPGAGLRLTRRRCSPAPADTMRRCCRRGSRRRSAVPERADRHIARFAPVPLVCGPRGGSGADPAVQCFQRTVGFG